ncbi:hypothetical protein GX51_04331 [Blastomyces parvus]|uniref:Protein kinase domain-containing protein n=1 Tax=Blastomyces parvus TaxID=2060905 RepID=A0A2B7X2J2_9EURO|nr:hypothetical protein GX51_04331 [Blastomyces parvus]
MEQSTSVEELRRLLWEERRARQKAEEERRKAEEEKQKAVEEKQKAEEERDQTKTTFQEYLDLCHIHFSKRLLVQLDRSRSTKGTVTSPKGGCYPKRLLPWEGFAEGQRRRFDDVYGFFHSPSGSPKLFTSRRTLEELGQALCDRVFASEDDLRPHQQLSVEYPVGKIINVLSTMERAPERFRVGRWMRFENHTNTLDEEDEEVQERLEALGLSTEDGKPSRPVAADRICVYRDVEDKNSLSYLIEYKPPHKLRGTDIEKGLRPMDLEREVVHEYRIPKDLEKRKQHDADRKVASVVTQTFDYMIHSGLEYSYLSTGKAFIFLKVEEADPTTVFYHRIMLDGDQREARTGAANGNENFQNGRVMGRASYPRRLTIRNGPRRPRRPNSRANKPANLVRSFNLRTRPTGRSRCNEDETLAYTHSDEDSSSETELGDKETPVRSNRMAPTLVEASTNSPISSQSGNQTREYCTQACLLGLVRRTALDEGCPNVSAHRAGRYGREHRITVEKLRRLGARGNLFRITLASRGYTFVGKGTIAVYVPDLQHESCIYQQLEKRQGHRAPVYLGNIGLVEPWVDIGVEIVHMLLMSWCGEVAKPSDVPDLDGEILRLVEEIRQMGVEHGDVRGPNILWNPQQQKLMAVDFERSYVVAPTFRPPLQGLSPNKQSRQPLGDGKTRRQKRRSMEGTYQIG